MEENKRVYPRDPGTGKWINYLLLFLCATLLLSGFLWRGGGDNVELIVAATPTPIPTDTVFDETIESREITLQSQTWYALQLGVFENEESAIQLAEDFQTKGAAGYVWKDSKFRALAALYDSKEDAQTVRTQLSSMRNIETFLFEIKLLPLTLRMRGMKGQLDILEAGFLHGHDLVSSLQGMSIRLDQQETSVPEMLEEVHSLNTQMQNISLRLTQRFTVPRHAAVQGLIDMMDGFGKFCQTLDAGATSVKLATEIKFQALSALYGLKTIYDGLGNT